MQTDFNHQGKPSSTLSQESLLSSVLKQDPILESLDQKVITNFSNDFTSLSFHFGDLIYEYLATSEQDNNQSDQDLYCITQGRVRLLSFDPQKQRQVSVEVLKQGALFGGDQLAEENGLSYQVVAADNTTPVAVARLRRSQQNKWFREYPQLKTLWIKIAQKRQRLIFLKTLTELRTFPAHRLQGIVPHLQALDMAAGTSLAEATPTQAGRFWLRQGQIHPSSVKAWGDTDPVGSDWVAQTPLKLYYLPQEHLHQLSTSEPDHHPETNNHQLSTPSPIVPKSEKSSQRQTAATSALPTETVEVEFPQPQSRRKRIWRRYPFIEQQSSSDCGIACLVMISLYWDKRLSINSVRSLGNVGRSGTSLSVLAKVAEKLGYIAKPVRGSLDALVSTIQNNPWIAHWQGDHYVVVYHVQKRRVLVADPARGKFSLSKREFLQGWTGYALLLNPTEQLKELPDEKPSLGRFFKLLFPYQSTAFQIILASLLIQVFGLVTPLFTQIILDQVVVTRSLSMLNVFAIGILIFGMAEVILSSTRQYLFSYLANILDLTMIGGFIRHTMKLPLKFFESRQVGDILTRVNENQKIQQFLLSNGMVAWLDILMSVVYLGLMFYYNWELTFLILAIIPPIMISTLIATPWMRKLSRQVFNQSAAENSALVETITGIETVKTTASEQELRWRWESHFTDFLNTSFRQEKFGIKLEALNGFINIIGSTALLWYGASLVIRGELTIGQLVAFNMLLGRVINPILALANIWDELQEVLIAVERLNDVFLVQSEETADQTMLPLPQLEGNVSFQNVVFGYSAEEGQNALDGVSFEANAGETIAIVGRSGSGKSTLVKLLQGLYQPDQGRIFIDGHDLRHVSPHSLRSQLGVVSQDCFLFSGTILENITMYRPEFSLEEVIEAAKLAEAHSFIQAMPLGYNTKVGERGATLSGGQRQRIAIARALLDHPKLLILDEATSALDTESEQRFQSNLKRLQRDRTTFIIAHRLSTVRDADCILVLNQGLLVEKGTHEELIEAQQLYYHLAKQQIDI
ncbi:bacteriocin-processing peptidase [Halothece sp. PCC 7418]|uniref:peptidase domain-containing ABC transporter n=1 Tax=Halothece sp. (strain PCC 7418) TaxID=65093 RepID=UPI0002A08A85|nr:peptidase domain-containing ABC transporter [Halothece sp. PCC 7418]AFZ43301.1 bacteriocin-processing peptidase [Halothece sp. PCC 7418]